MEPSEAPITHKSDSKIAPVTGLPASIVFYCKDCRLISNVKRVGRQYVYICARCGTKNVAFGTPKSIGSFFHVKEEELMVNDQTPPHLAENSK